MRKCINCGGNNFDAEIFCDWCGEKLLPERRMTLILFLKYYFHNFAILGVVGAIIFYISTFLASTENSDLLKKELLSVSLENVLQFGLFICFCFFGLLLILLINEIIKAEKKNFSLKFLLFFLLSLLTFVIFLFLVVGLKWLTFIVLLIITIVIFAIFYHIMDIHVFCEHEIGRKIWNIGGISLIAIAVIVGFLVIFNQLQLLVNYLSNISIPFETTPTIMHDISNGFFLGIFFGDLLGLFLSAIVLMIYMFKAIIEDFLSAYEKIS